MSITRRGDSERFQENCQHCYWAFLGDVSATLERKRNILLFPHQAGGWGPKDCPGRYTAAPLLGSLHLHGKPLLSPPQTPKFMSFKKNCITSLSLFLRDPLTLPPFPSARRTFLIQGRSLLNSRLRLRLCQDYFHYPPGTEILFLGSSLSRSLP